MKNLRTILFIAILLFIVGVTSCARPVHPHRGLPPGHAKKMRIERPLPPPPPPADAPDHHKHKHKPKPKPKHDSK